MAHCHSHGKICFSAQQTDLQRCALLEIWLDTQEVALALPMWKSILSGTCIQLFERRLSSIRHNRVRYITAQLLTEVCPNVGIEPTLQPLTGESFPLRSTNVEEGARLDIRAQDFWDSSKRSTFFDVRVFNSHAPSNSKSSTSACYRRHEKEKRREYERRILEVEHGTFTPLFLSTSGRWGPSATVAFRRLAGLISSKQGQSYNAILQFIRCKISYSLIYSASMCLRGP